MTWCCRSQCSATRPLLRSVRFILLGKRYFEFSLTNVVDGNGNEKLKRNRRDYIIHLYHMIHNFAATYWLFVMTFFGIILYKFYWTIVINFVLFLVNNSTMEVFCFSYLDSIIISLPWICLSCVVITNFVLGIK